MCLCQINKDRRINIKGPHAVRCALSVAGGYCFIYGRGARATAVNVLSAPEL